MTQLGRSDDGQIEVVGGTDGTAIGNTGDRLKVEAADVSTPDTSGVYGSLTVGTTAVVVRVGGSNLANRKYILVQARDNSIYWGYNSSVTTSTGTQIFKDQLVILPLGDSIDMYLIADGAGRNARIGELS